MAAESITIRTDRETIERLDKLAQATERSRNYLVNQALQRFIEEQDWQLRAIEVGLESLDAGAGVPHEEVMAGIRAKIRAAAETA